MLEKEVRYQINEDTKKKILQKCSEVTDVQRVTDITVGKDGFNSLDKYGYIIRLRNKNGKKTLECKKRIEDGWDETVINVDNFEAVLKVFNIMGYKPYLLLDRKRINAKYNGLILAFDDVELLGSFIEIEYQNANFETVNNFLTEFNIKGEPQKLYGDIFKDKLEDEEFRKSFNRNLKRIK